MAYRSLVKERLRPEPPEAAFEGQVCQVYQRTGSLELTADLVAGVSTATQVARIVRRNGGEVKNPGRPNVVQELGEQIRQLEDRFPTRAALAAFFGVSPSTIYRALRESNKI